ncbi:hypothetical protein Mapa_003584 [Marchantia paleacea]|nr:hypothetical protein Mapa_003584 [Marchantia paleacea]
MSAHSSREDLHGLEIGVRIQEPLGPECVGIHPHGRITPNGVGIDVQLSVCRNVVACYGAGRAGLMRYEQGRWRVETKDFFDTCLQVFQGRQVALFH